jgi:two-component sensor histidine kinase
MALAGGFWPGITTLAAAVVAGSILFLPPAFSLALADGAGWTMLMFAVFGTINVILVSGLMAGILLHDEHQQFLLQELQHRSRNLFTVVQSIVSRILVQSDTVFDAKQAVELRLAALARTHALLANNGWTGASLDQIISEELTGFTNQSSCTGCGLLLNTPAAQTFALIIHELSTNAVKHGALSRLEGRVAIEGRMEPSDGNILFRFTWTETGGPTAEPPRRQGFGSSILRGIAKRFAESVEVNYRPEGLMYELKIPISSIRGSETLSIVDTAPKTNEQRGAAFPSRTRKNGTAIAMAG